MSVRRGMHVAHIRSLLREMRRCLKESEKARDTFYRMVEAYKVERGLSGYELNEAVGRDMRAKNAISDSQLYDRWATKYATVIQAEIAAYNIGLHLEDR